MKLVAVGTVAFDEIETPFGSSGKIVGGAATYIGLSASLLTPGVGIVSVVGQDFPQEMLGFMRQRGIDLKGLEILEGEKSFFWAGRYHYDMNSRDTLATELNVLIGFNPKLPEAYRRCEYLMLGNLDPAVQNAVLDQITQRPKLVVLDTMNFWMDQSLNELLRVISRVDVITINDAEARQLSGEHSLVKAARKIMAMGPSYVVIKKGEHGALLFHAGQVFVAPALPLEDVVDPTGAGDSFAGGLIGHVAKTGDRSFRGLKQGVVVGSAIASFTCERFGTKRLENLSIDEIETRRKEFENLVEVS
jgi:sugar/nucleoside kinase (ribokinase family)